MAKTAGIAPATIADGIAVKRPGELTLPLLAEHADAVCFRCKVRLKDHRNADHLFFEDPEDAPDEEFN